MSTTPPIPTINTSDDITPGPFSEHELRIRWNEHADEFNQWESLDLSEQLAWAQSCAIAADRTRAELAQPEPEETTRREARIHFESFAATFEASGGDSDLILRALARPCRPAIKPVPVSEPGVADHITDDVGTRWDHTMDAALWAKAFCLICPEMASREDVMIGWFANAIMAGCDHQAWKMDAERRPVPVSERSWEREGWCDVEGRCWWFNHAGIPEWQLASDGPYGDFSLPHYALPVPTSQEIL